MFDAIAEVVQTANRQPDGDASNNLQLYLLIIQALWAVIMMIAGLVLAMLNRTLSRMGQRQDEIYELLLTKYATRDEVSERVHGLRDAMGIHSTWIHLLALAMKVDLPHLHSRSKDGD